MPVPKNTSWKFQSEQQLEDFVWDNLEPLLGLTPLARQHYSSSQICDILAVDARRQLVVIELKNDEDRYIVQQLTRYYSALRQEKPFAAQVDYRLPIRLMAIAPTFHAHTLIDREYSRLELELLRFEVIPRTAGFRFELRQWDEKRALVFDIPALFHSSLMRSSEPVLAPPQAALPPKSLQKLLQPLSPEQQALVLQVRAELLQADSRLKEVGKTTTTQYGFPKADRSIPVNKLCAAFRPNFARADRPRLLLRLPYPKREFGGPGRTYKQQRVKGIAWYGVHFEREWDAASPITLLLFLDKTQYQCSRQYSLEAYASLYRTLTGSDCDLRSINDLVAASVKEWQLQLDDVADSQEGEKGDRLI